MATTPHHGNAVVRDLLINCDAVDVRAVHHERSGFTGIPLEKVELS
jgi:hypothetical protein